MIAPGRAGGAVAGRDRRAERGAVVAPLLIGIDEGTTAVKAVLYDETPDAAARGPPPQAVAPPASRLGRAGPRGDPRVGRRRGRRAARGRARRGRRLRARPPGRVGARLGRRDRRAAVAGRRLAGQAPDRAARRARRGRRSARAAACRWTRTSRPASSPGCCATASHGHAVAAARQRRRVAHRPARRRLRHRRVDRLAHAAAPARRPGLGPLAVRARSACRPTRSRRSATASASSACCATSAGRSTCR